MSQDNVTRSAHEILHTLLSTADGYPRTHESACQYRLLTDAAWGAKVHETRREMGFI